MRNGLFTLLLIAGLTAPAGAHHPAPEGWKDGYVMANGIRIHYWRTGGKKRPIVLAHGYSDFSLCWAGLAGELAGKFDVIMVDARGHGLSDPGGVDDPADVQADDLAGFIRALKLDKPIVMGHSMGSSAVAWMAAKYPELPGAVILEDPGLTRRPSSGAADDSAARMAQILKLNNLTHTEIVEICRTKYHSKWTGLSAYEFWEELNDCEYWADAKKLHHPNSALRNPGARPAASELFPKIIRPTLILKADAKGKARQANEKVAALLPHGTIVHIKGAGHNVRRDQKRLTLEALMPFLESLE